MTGMPSVILNETARVALVAVAFVAVTLTEVTPVVVGVPEIRPVLVFKVRPGGNAVELKLVGLLVAVI